MKMKTILFLIALLVSTSAHSDTSESTPEKKPLSMKTVRILSALPLNSPALFYARRPISGTVTTVTEGLGLTLITLGSLVLAEDCVGNSSIDNAFCDFGSLAGRVFVISGALLWIPSYTYGLLKAPQAAEEYNALHGRSQISWHPYILAGENGVKAGLRVRF